MGVKGNLENSSADFMRVVWPDIKEQIGGGDIEPVESASASGFLKAVDCMAGIDAWQIVNGKGIRGIASRVQYNCDFQTFTVRVNTRRGSSETEFSKIARIVRGAERGFLSPGLVCQAYVTGDPGKATALTHALITKASDFYPVVEMAFREWEAMQRVTDDFTVLSKASFSIGRIQKVPPNQLMAVFERDDLVRHGLQVKLIHRRSQAAAA